MFGIAEIFRNLEHERRREVMQGEIGRLMPSRQELRASAAPVMRGTVIGSLLGILPGGGALLSSFASYALEKRVSRTPERFGKGAVEGVAGPESANNAGAQTSFIPMLTLGIPSNAVMALMIGAMIIQGVVPGPNVVTQQPELFWGLIASMWIGNAMLLFLNLPLIGLWVKMLKIPYGVLFPAIIAFSSLGVYTVSGNPFHLYTVAFFGALSYLLVKLDCEPTPMLLGFVLGPLFEDNLRQALVLSRGDPTVFVTRPISATLLAAVAIALAVMALPALQRKRKEVFTED
jgi:TctA family transporter